MLDGLPAELIGAAGPTALAALAVLLVLTGRLVPLSTHLREVASQVARADDWRAAAHTERERADEYARQVSEILTALRQPRET